EDLVQFVCLVAFRIDDFASFEIKTDTVESGALINARRVKRKLAFHRVFHRSSENFAIRNVAIAAADDSWNSFDTKIQIRAGTLDLDAVRLFHQPLKRLHPGLQFAVVERADIEKEIFKRFGAHPCKLSHRGCWPS